MGAGVPANTGEARAMHRGACFAGTPAPTGAKLPQATAYACAPHH
ncbi:diguanylate cyclase [Pseudomonas plecoglossicida]|uniref:Diguanylate cyclase n=1 Tax=Pseudomonas plecoglossicida TaxID=70775 RepID=A0A2R7UII7_PSEDL|nr:diguanylate cyclase [Pseudomonas plecoglossicida]